jgi:hypothetical protein
MPEHVPPKPFAPGFNIDKNRRAPAQHGPEGIISAAANFSEEQMSHHGAVAMGDDLRKSGRHQVGVWRPGLADTAALFFQGAASPGRIRALPPKASTKLG